MLKKILKITGIVFLVLVVAAFAIPYFFKDQIKAKILSSINENVDAKVAFDDADLSLFKNFPNASVTIDKLSIINKAPFEGDTLVAFEELNLKMSIKEIFKGEKRDSIPKTPNISRRSGKCWLPAIAWLCGLCWLGAISTSTNK